MEIDIQDETGTHVLQRFSQSGAKAYKRHGGTNDGGNSTSTHLDSDSCYHNRRDGSKECQHGADGLKFFEVIKGVLQKICAEDGVVVGIIRIAIRIVLSYCYHGQEEAEESKCRNA